MSLHEKLALLEAVWTELATVPENIEVPQWHRDLLDEREARLQAGEEKVMNWEEAKEQIRRTVS